MYRFMPRFKFALLPLLVVAVLFSLVRPAFAGDPKPVPQLKRRPPVNQSQADNRSYVTLKVTTNLVVLDVVATDKKGKAITDLKQGDFTLLEDNKEQKISIFQLQQPPVALASAKTPAPPLPPDIFTNAAQVQPPGPRNVIVLDSWRSSPESQSFARSQIIKYVKEIPPNEPVAIFQFGSSGIRMLQDFTTDQALLLEAAKKIKPLLSLAQVSGREWGTGRYLSFPGQYFGNVGAGGEMEALREFSATLAAYPGRKNLIWISDSFTATPYSFGSAGGNPLLDRSLVLGAFDFIENRDGAETKKTARAMIDSQVAIYPVDPVGVEGVPRSFTAESGGSPFDASQGGFGGFSGFGGFGGSSRFSSFADSWGSGFAIPESPLFRGSIYRREVYREMDDLAARTGGKAFYSRNDLAHAIRDGITDGSTYYVLGYYPSNHYWDGRFRQIEVKVNRPDIKLGHRPGYTAIDAESYAKRPVEMQNADLRRALNLSTPVETMLTVYTQVKPPSSETQNQVAVQYSIYAKALDFEHGDDVLEHASVDCVAQAFTEKGEVVKASANTYLASLKPETFKQVSQNGFPCKQSLDLPAGSYILKLAARDNRTGAIGTVNAKVTVPKLPAKAPSAARPEQKKM